MPIDEKTGQHYRNSGRNKTRAKKREYKAHVRNMILAERINDARGHWVPAPSSLSDYCSKMAQHMGGNKKKR